MSTEQLIKKGEGLTTDFKQVVPGDLGKVIASFASTQGVTILIGVDSNQNIVGVDLSKIDHEQSKVDQAIQNIHPTCVCDYEQVAIQGKLILIIRLFILGGTVLSRYLSDFFSFFNRGFLNRKSGRAFFHL